MIDATSIDKSEQQLAIQRLVDGLALKSKQQDEQQSVPRYPLNLPVTLSNQINCSAQTHTYGAWVTELSHKGVSLLTAVELFPEKNLFINFDPAIGRPCHLRILVTHCDKLIDGIYRGGGNFCFDRQTSGSEYRRCE